MWCLTGFGLWAPLHVVLDRFRFGAPRHVVLDCMNSGDTPDSCQINEWPCSVCRIIIVPDICHWPLAVRLFIIFTQPTGRMCGIVTTESDW
jgi:hypothetical protein